SLPQTSSSLRTSEGRHSRPRPTRPRRSGRRSRSSSGRKVRSANLYLPSEDDAKTELYREIGKTWQTVLREKSGDILARAIQLRREPTILRVERPSRLDRARMLGYKAKQGVAVVRVRGSRGGMRRQRPRAGTRPNRLGAPRIKSSV